MKRPSEPRIPPVDVELLTESQRAIPGITVANVLRTLVRHEDLLTAWLTLAGKLGYGGGLAPRDRELAILKVALRTECEYEWAHALLALGVGITEAEIKALSNPAATWSDADAALLHAVDEVCSDDCVSDETWAALAATHDDVQLIELLALVGFYRMNAGLLNSLGVQPEPGRPHLGEVPSLSGVSAWQSPALTPSSTGSPSGAPTDRRREVRVDGAWRIVFHHPTGDQDLTLVLDTSKGGISGSVTNPALAISIPIVEGTVDGNHLVFRAPMNEPLEFEISYQGIVDGDRIAGDVTIQGGGTFPFDGTRA